MVSTGRKRVAKRFKVALGSRISAERGKRRWSQMYLAELLDCLPRTVQRYERGHVAIGLAALDNIAAVFGMPLQELIGDAEALSSFPTTKDHGNASGTGEDD